MEPIQPEICYPFIPLCLDEIKRAYEQNESVTGFVEKICSDTSTCRVHLGQGIWGTLPFDDASIYNLRTDDSNIPLQVYYIKGTNIRVKVTQITPTIMLSRKDNMLEAFGGIKKGDFCDAEVKNRLPDMFVLDIGEGLCGNLRMRNVNSSTAINKGDIIRVKLLNSNEKRVFYTSFDNMDYSKYLKRTFRGKITGRLNDTHYFVEFPKHVTGVLNLSERGKSFQIGEEVACYVHGYTEKGLELCLDKHLNS